MPDHRWWRSSVGSGVAGDSGSGAAGGSTKGLSKAQIAAGLRVVNGHVVKSLNAGPNKFLRADCLVNATKHIDGIPLPESLAWMLVAAVLFLGSRLRHLPQAALGPRVSTTTRTGAGGQPVRGPAAQKSRWASPVAGGGRRNRAGRLPADRHRCVNVDVTHHGVRRGRGGCHSDGGLGCTATIPCSSHACPTLDVAPVSDLVDSQYIYVKATSFPTGDTMRVAICSTSPTVSPDPTDPTCLNGTVGGQLLGARPRSPSPRTRPSPTCPKSPCRPSSTPRFG